MQDNSEENTQTGSSVPPTLPESIVDPVVAAAEAIVPGSVSQTEDVNETNTEVVTDEISAPVEVAHPSVDAAVTTHPTTVVPVVVSGSRVVKQYAIAGVIVLLMGVGLWYVLEAQGRVNTGVFATVNELIKPTPAAAVLNGVKIPMNTYEKNRSQIEKNAEAQGLKVDDEAVKTEITKQAIDVLVNTELLKQAAAKENITATQEQIDARYQEIITSLGGEEALKAKMSELGITEESLQSDIKGEIIIQAYLSQAVDVSKIVIEEADIKKVYDQANTPGAKLPPLAEVKAEIETQLKSTKEQELVNAHIEMLRADAKIETKV